jgi:hypothetical protein
VLGRASTTGQGYGTSTTRRSCRAGPGTIKSGVTQVGPPDTAYLTIYTSTRWWWFRLSCRHLVRHPASFLSLLIPPLLGRGRGSRRLLSFRPTPAPTPTCIVAIARPRGRFTTCAHHRFRCCRTSRLSSRPLPYSSSPTYCPHPWSQSRADRRSLTWVRASRSFSWPFSARAIEEDMVAPATLRLSWRWGVQVWYIGQPRSVAWQQSTYDSVGGGVVSPRRVQGWEGTRILSPFSDWRLVRVPLGLELLRLGFFIRLCALSQFVFSGILPMSPPDA